MHSYRLTPSLIALVGAVLAAPVAAQTAVAAAKPADDSGLAEIVVTAEKRSSTIQDTAISMSALSGEQLPLVQIRQPRR